MPGAASQPKGRQSKATTKNGSSSDPVSEYARDVLAGKIIAGPDVRNACARHLRDVREAAKRGLVWDLHEANEKIAFFPGMLRLAGGQFEGIPFELHCSQKFIVGSIFGWKRADGTRRFRRAYIEQGKGNGKSPLAAGIGMIGLVGDGEARAEIYAAASKKDQAMVLFRDAVAMRDQSPGLRRRITKSGGNPVWNLSYIERGSFFRPISSDEGQSGPRPHFALCDEVHEHPDSYTLEMLERGFKWRRNPLLVMITNSGTDRKSVCWAEHEAARVAAKGDRDHEEIYNRTFAFVCSLDEGDDPLEDSSCWPKANPLLDVTQPSSELAAAVSQAKAVPGRLNNVLRLHFCVWTDSDKAWMSREAIEAVLADFDPKDHAEADISVGIDLSAFKDLTALACVVKTGEVERKREDGTKIMLPTYDAWIEAWTPLDTLKERALIDKAPYDVWVAQGFLRAPPGKMIRMDFVAARLAEINSEYVIKIVAYDRYAYRKLEDELDEIGLDLPSVAHPQAGKVRARVPDELIAAAKAKGEEPPQGLWMPGSLSELETLILDKRIRLHRNPVLVSAIMSAATDEDANGNRWLSKRKATNRIDPAVALCMSIGGATSHLTGPRTREIKYVAGEGLL